MSKRKERTPLSDRARGRALRTWGFYLLALTAWVTVVLLLAFLGYLVCSAITWYDPLSPLYLFLNWVRDYFVFVCALVVLAGWVVISYFFIARPVGQVEAMAQAAEKQQRRCIFQIVTIDILAENHDFPLLFLLFSPIIFFQKVK